MAEPASAALFKTNSLCPGLSQAVRPSERGASSNLESERSAERIPVQWAFLLLIRTYPEARARQLLDVRAEAIN